MKTIVFWVSVFFVLFSGNRVEAQVVDSAAVAREVDSLIQVSRALTGKRDFDKALEINIATEKIALEKFGRESASYANACINHGRVLHIKGDLSEAEKWYLESKVIRENVLSKEHPQYAGSLHNLAALYVDMGNYEKAEPSYLEALAIREKVLGKEHPDYAQSLYSLANLYSDMGNYEKAEPLYLEALGIREKVLGKEHPDYAWSLNGLANLYCDIGNYKKAEPLYLEALTILRKKEHPDYTASLYNIAKLYWMIGDYKKAEPLLLELKAIKEKTRGKEHPEYAQILSNLAVLYATIGDYEKAVLLSLESKDIWEKTLGKENPDYARNLSNLANLYLDMGDYKKSEPFHLESKAIREKTLGKEHPEYAQSLSNLANLYSKMGDYEKVEPLYLESKAIREKTLGKEHPGYAVSLNNLAGFYYSMDDYEKAMPLFLEALAIREKTLGKEHPNYAVSLNNLAILFWSTRDFETAKPYLSEVLEIEKKLLLKASQHLSERELSMYVNTFNSRLKREFSFAQIRGGISAACYDNALFYKGFLLNNVSQVSKLALTDSASAEKYQLFKSYHRRLAAEYSKPVAERENVAALEEKANALEKDLARTVIGFGEALRQVNWQEVRSNLQPGEAAVEFLHYEFVNPKPTDSTMYAALVLLPSDTTPHFLPLFEQKQLDTLLSKTESRSESVKALYVARTGIVLDEIPAYGTELYNLIWKPLDSLLQGVKTVYYSPSGLLHRVNLAAIPVDSTHVLADKYTLRQMSSTRNLVVKTPEPVPAGYIAALFGGIQYDSDSTALSSAALASRGSETPASRSTLEYTADAQRDTAKVWTYLEGTHTEVDSLQRQMQRNGLNVKTFMGLAATEESLKALGSPLQGDKSPDILHIATHGFFFDDPEKRRQQRFGDENVFRWNENPLFRSGLIMAGADHAWQTGRPYANLEDGICTAYEISHLNLTNTKLAVLSACETGLGDIKGSEGVYGLQRAFKMAGVDYLIVSLWKVPDAQTVEFMDAFYRNWLGGETIHEAFAKAQQMMRQKYGVYEWGAWVLIE